MNMSKKYFEKRFRAIEKNSSYEENPPFPTNALIELTNGCNHACIFCKNSHQIRHTTYLEIKKYYSFIKQAVGLGLKEVGLYATGEPFMTKNLHEYIRVAKDLGIKRVYITTNGALASINKIKKCVENGLDSIKFSINASNREDYNEIHGYDDFNKVLNNVKDIYEWKIKNKINLQLLGSCVLVPSKPYTKEQHTKLFGKYFDDILYNKSQSQGGQKFDIPLQEKNLRGVFTAQKIVHDKDLQPCSMVFNRYHLTAEGYLTACCVDYNLNLVYSDLDEEKLESAWQNEFIRNLRLKHINKNLDGTICKQCLKNKKYPYTPLRNLSSKNYDDKKFKILEIKLIKRIKSASS